MIVVYTDKGKAPVPEGWKLERVIEILKECGHQILRVEELDKKMKRAG